MSKPLSVTIGLGIAAMVVGCGPRELPRVNADDLQALIDETAADGRVTVIDFWATWCVPCVEMFPDLHAGLAGRDDIRLVSVTIDALEYEQPAIEFLTQQHALADAYMAEEDTDARLAIVNRFGEQWNSLVVPAVLVFDRQGELVGEFLGPEPRAIIAAAEAAAAD